ncbi:MAG TPA: glycoside hydrolase family 88 protein, partial [Steroidobacteraceae bacterium]|nr:glycoside hydrolase family 88 protein [Steroidobacteraceae bacterium]
MTALVSVFICLALLLAGRAEAQATPNQIHISPQQDPGVYSGRLKVDYPTRYELASVDDVRKTLEHVHAYVDKAAPVQVIDGETGAPVADLARLPANVALARTDMQILTYEWGVTYAGMLRSAQVTGDKRYNEYTRARVSAIATLAAHAKKNLPPGTTHSNYPMPKHGLGLRSILIPGRLDDSGAMCAALIKAELAGLGDEKLRPWIDNYVQYVSTKQFRLNDG